MSLLHSNSIKKIFDNKINLIKMNLSNLVAVSGKPGIYRMSANRPNGLIVEDLDNGKKTFVSGRIHQFTPLESISIYTETEENTVELKDVFRKMLEQIESNPPIDVKASADATRAYFEDILPSFDRDRVYVSDIKKLVKWFSFLNDRNLLSLEDEVEEETETTSEEA